MIFGTRIFGTSKVVEGLPMDVGNNVLTVVTLLTSADIVLTCILVYATLGFYPVHCFLLDSHAFFGVFNCDTIVAKISMHFSFFSCYVR